jgi:hypothetical protein
MEKRGDAPLTCPRRASRKNRRAVDEAGASGLAWEELGNRIAPH